jgi:hypothetical protein
MMPLAFPMTRSKVKPRRAFRRAQCRRVSGKNGQVLPILPPVASEAKGIRWMGHLAIL